MMNSSGSGWKNGLGGPQPQPPQKKMADVDVSNHNKTGSPSSSYPPGGGQASQAGGSHYFARGSGIRQAASLPTTSPLGFLRSAGKASASTASLKPSAAQRMTGIESERGMRPPPAVEVRDMAATAAGVRNSSRMLRRVESEKMMAVDDDDGVGSLQSSSSSTELGYDDERRSVDAQLARNMLDTQLNDQFHTQKKNSLAYISFFKNAQKYSESLQESAEYGAEMSRAMIKMTKTAPNSEEDSEIIESMSVSWGGMMQLQQHCLRPLFTEDEFAEKFQLYDGVAEVVSLEKEYKKQHAVYTQRLKRYEKSIRKERTKKAKQNSATLVSDSIDMQLLQTSFDEWRAQMMEDLTEMERVRQARFACLFWQNLERQLEHYRTFISLLEKEKNSWESRYRAVASTTPTAPAPSIAPTPAPAATTNTNPDATPKSKEAQVRESRKGKHHSAGEVSHALSSSRLSSSPLLSGSEVTRSATSPPHPKGVSFEARNDTDSEPLTSDSEGPDPFVEEVDHLLQGELDERQRKVTISTAVAQHKIKRPNSKRQSTIALASQLLDWCFQTDASMTAMPITRKTTASSTDGDTISEGVANNENENENDKDKDNENDNGDDSRVDNDRDFEKEERNNDDVDVDDKQPNNNNNNKNNHSNNHDSNRLNPNNAESEGEPPLERQRLHSAADILDSIFAVDPPAVHAPTAPASTAAGASSLALQASIGGSGSATQYRPSIGGNKSQRVSIGCRRRSPSPAAAASNDSGPGDSGDKKGEHNKDHS